MYSNSVVPCCLWQPVAAEHEAPARGAGLGEEAGGGDLARDHPGDALVLRRCQVGEGGREPGRAAADLQIAQVAIAELREGPVADVERPAAEAAPAGHGEVPGQEQVAPPDARFPQLAEQALEVGPAALDQGPARSRAVAVEPEGPAGTDRAPAGTLEVAQGDDVTPALAEVPGRPDDEHAVGLGLRVGVDLRPDRVAPAGARVDHHHGRPPGQAARHVADRRQPAGPGGLDAVQAGHLGQQHRAGAEAVGPVHVGGIDVHAVLVGRHGASPESEATAGGRVAVALGEEVVGPGIETDRRVREVAALRRPLPLGLGGGGRQQRHSRDRHRGPASPPHRARKLHAIPT